MPPTTSPAMPKSARIPPVGSNSSAANNPNPIKAMTTNVSMPWIMRL